MITLNYTLKEMMSALEKIGYDIKAEYLEPDWYELRNAREDYPVVLDSASKHRTYMVYFAGECVTCGTKFARLYGYERLQEIFQLELRKRVLGLF